MVPAPARCIPLFATLWSLSHIVRRPTDRPAGVRERAHTGGGARDPVSAPALVPPARPAAPARSCGSRHQSSSHLSRISHVFSRRPGPSREARTRPPARRGRAPRGAAARARPATHTSRAGRQPAVPRAHGARAPHQARRVARARSGGHGGASVTSANRVCGPEFARLPVWDFNLRTPIPNHVPLVHGGVPRTDCPRGRGRSAATGSQSSPAATC